MYEIDALPLNFTDITVYADIGIACDGPKVRMCAWSDNTAMTTDLMVISYNINARFTAELCLDYVLELLHTYL